MVNLIQGDGSLFWNHGMHKAFEHAVLQGYDFYLWINDDTYLYPDALQRLMDTYRQVKRTDNSPAIIIGSVQDPHTGQFTYGGIVQGSGWNPLKLQRQPPYEKTPQLCYTMNGNCVLIDHAAVEKTGNLDKVFQHRWGDFDYGMRASRKGVKLWIAPGFVGSCQANEVRELWKDPALRLSQRFKVFNSIKGFKFSEWLVYSYRHGGFFWWMNFLNPYVDMLFPGFKSFLKSNNKLKLKLSKL
jgi:GT2 family glycosyltransferase